MEMQVARVMAKTVQPRLEMFFFILLRLLERAVSCKGSMIGEARGVDPGCCKTSIEAGEAEKAGGGRENVVNRHRHVFSLFVFLF